MKPLVNLLWLCMALASCSVPDDENWKTLNRGIDAIPPPVKIDAKRWAANRQAVDDLHEFSPDDEIFTVNCEEMAGTAVPDPEGDYAKKYRFTVADVLRCLLAGSGADQGNRTYVDCIAQLTSSAEGSYADETGFAPDCFPWFAPGWGKRDLPIIPHDWDAKLVVTHDVASALVSSPTLPAWFFASVTLAGSVLVIISGGSGVVVVGPALCALREGEGNSCPGDPSYPPGQTPQPDGTP